MSHADEERRETPSPAPLFFVLGWLVVAWSLEQRPPPAPEPSGECVLLEGGQESPWSPVDLRVIAGVGRLRARQLAQAAWGRDLALTQPDLESHLQELPGVGPVTAARVSAWAARTAWMARTRAAPPGPHGALGGPMPAESKPLAPERRQGNPPAALDGNR